MGLVGVGQGRGLWIAGETAEIICCLPACHQSFVAQRNLGGLLGYTLPFSGGSILSCVISRTQGGQRGGSQLEDILEGSERKRGEVTRWLKAQQFDPFSQRLSVGPDQVLPNSYFPKKGINQMFIFPGIGSGIRKLPASWNHRRYYEAQKTLGGVH